MDLNLLVFSNIISFILFTLAGLFLFLRRRNAQLSVNVLIPLFLSILIYTLIALSNILEHSGVTDCLDSSEDIIEIVFLFICILFVNNWNFQISLREREKHNFRQNVALDLGKLVYWKYDVATDLFTFNDRAYTLLGTSASEQGGYRMSSAEYTARFTPQEEAAVVAQEIETALKADDPDFIRRFELRMIRRADAQERYLDISFAIVKDKVGQTVKVYGAGQDITERKRVELALQSENKRRRLLMDASRDGIAIFNQAHQVIEANQRFCEMLGYSPEEVLALYTWDIDVTLSEEQVRLDFANLTDTNKTFETQHRRKDGSIYNVEVSVSGVLIDGEPLIMTISRDITERRRSEKALQNSEKRLQEAQKMANVGNWELDISTKTIWGSNHTFKMYGITPSPENTVPSTKLETCIQDIETHNQALSALIENNLPYDIEYKLRPANGQSPRIIHSIAKCILDKNKVPKKVVGVIQDITEKKVYEKQLELFATIIEQADEEVVIADPEGYIQYVNPSFEINTGYQTQEVLGKTPAVLKSGLHDRNFYKDLWQTILAKQTWKGFIKNKCKDGAIVFDDTVITPIVDHNNNISAFVSIRRDITKQVQMEEQIQQTQKMQAIGTLAGGIAHDFNNILSGIFGYCQLARNMIEDKDSDKAKDYIEKAVKSAQRASELVQQILTFSRQTEYEKRPFRIYLEIKEALKLLRSIIPVTIGIKQQLDSRSMILADPIKIHQVLMNLCTNAYHSMRKTGGVLTVCLTDQQISESKQVKDKIMPIGKYLVLQINDTGDGMDKKTLERAFEPYFTTKKKGDGAGLGLAIVQAIVEEHDGFLEVFSTPGEGTHFSLYFPVVEKPTDSRKEKPEESVSFFGNETVMIVDDEEAIRHTYKGLIEAKGYEVVTFSNGNKALDAFKSDPGKFDIMITDMTMPGITGAELIKKIKAVKNHFPIILCSGFSELINEKKALQIGVSRYLSKPIYGKDLIKNIREALDEKYQVHR